jgi:hypothetical protein
MDDERRPEKIGELESRFLSCRDLGHAWDWVTDFEPIKAGNTVIEMTRIVQCQRCKGKRHDTFAMPTMKKVGSQYFHTPGYRMHVGYGRVLTHTARVEILKRMKNNSWKKD